MNRYSERQETNGGGMSRHAPATAELNGLREGLNRMQFKQWVVVIEAGQTGKLEYDDRANEAVHEAAALVDEFKAGGWAVVQTGQNGDVFTRWTLTKDGKTITITVKHEAYTETPPAAQLRINRAYRSFGRGETEA